MRYIVYQGRFCDQGVRNTQAILVEASRNNEEATLCLASTGGDVSAGVGLYNFLKMLPGGVYTHAMGLCASIACLILLAGKRRTGSVLSFYTLHASRYIAGDMKGQIAPDTIYISQPFRDILKWSEDDIVVRFGATDFNFGAEEALKLGVIQEIEDLRIAESDSVEIVPISQPAGAGSGATRITTSARRSALSNHAEGRR